MTNDNLLIDLDDYLDLSNFSLCTKDFKDKFHLIPDESINVGGFTPDVSIEDKVDSKTILLRVLKNKDDWKDWGLIDKEEKWKDDPLYELFPNIREFISTLPFKSIGRVFISFTQNKTNIESHADFIPNHPKTPPWRQEYLWFSLIGGKRLWVTDWKSTLEFYKNGFVVEDKFPKTYSKGTSCRFNPIMLHGVECEEDFSASIRVDGQYTEDFRETILGDREWKTTYEYVDEEGYLIGF